MATETQAAENSEGCDLVNTERYSLLSIPVTAAWNAVVLILQVLECLANAPIIINGR